MIDLVCGSGNGALRCKSALHLLGLISTPTMRLPQVAADEAETEHVRSVLSSVGLLS